MSLWGFIGYFLLVMVVTLPVTAETLSGQVIGVTDGDTITILDSEQQSHRIRLAGIDAPEKKQPFGERARQRLATLVFRKPVEIEWHKRDRYGRIIGKVWMAQSASGCTVLQERLMCDISLAQIESGLAWHYRKYAKEQNQEDRMRYARAEEEARAAQRGLWSETDPIPPWQWRAR